VAGAALALACRRAHLLFKPHFRTENRFALLLEML